MFTAGNPMKEGELWTNLTLVKIHELLLDIHIRVSCPVIKKLLKVCGYVKRKMQKVNTLKEVADRNIQFEYIAQVRKNFVENNLPILSIDTKKKEMLGDFYREGKLYTKEAIRVNDHDFNSFSEGIVIPHGIYDVTANTCHLSIGTSKDTAEFVSDNIEHHWNNSIKARYPGAKKMLILCDGGGSNSSRHYVVKEQLFSLSKKLNMEIVVAHYPPCCSKWNPIEHMAFSFISKAWSGIVFKNHEIIMELAESATTRTGFSVKAWLNAKEYLTGKKVANEFLENMPVHWNKFLPKWNYSFANIN
jgi:hypothetical protein